MRPPQAMISQETEPGSRTYPGKRCVLPIPESPTQIEHDHAHDPADGSQIGSYFGKRRGDLGRDLHQDGLSGVDQFLHSINCCGSESVDLGIRLP